MRYQAHRNDLQTSLLNMVEPQLKLSIPMPKDASFSQMALLMHQPSIWRSELAAVESSLLDRFDPKSVDTIAATRLVRELAAVPVSLSLPDIVDSIAALEAVRLSESTSNKNGN